MTNLRTTLQNLSTEWESALTARSAGTLSKVDHLVEMDRIRPLVRHLIRENWTNPDLKGICTDLGLEKTYQKHERELDELIRKTLTQWMSPTVNAFPKVDSMDITRSICRSSQITLEEFYDHVSKDVSE